MFNEKCKQIGTVNSNKQKNVSALNSWLQPSEGKQIAKGKKEVGRGGKELVHHKPVTSGRARGTGVRQASQEGRTKGRMLPANTPPAPPAAESCASPRTPYPEPKR